MTRNHLPAGETGSRPALATRGERGARGGPTMAEAGRGPAGAVPSPCTTRTADVGRSFHGPVLAFGNHSHGRSR